MHGVYPVRRSSTGEARARSFRGGRVGSEGFLRPEPGQRRAGNAARQRQPRQALENLRALLASKQSEVLLLWSIADLVRQALRVASGRGSTSYQGARAGWGRRPFSTQEIALLAARKYSHQELLHALQHVRRADLAIKSSWKDSRILLEFLVWQIIVGKASGGAQPITEEVPLSSEA